MKVDAGGNMGRATHLPGAHGPLPWVVIGLVLVLLAPVPASAAAPLDERLAKALAVPRVASAETGAVAVDLKTGRTVFSLNETRSLRPASTEKLAVALAALHELGPDYRIATDVLGDGGLEDTTWHGDLVLKGYGDPTLSRGDLRALARGVRAFGIRRVTGAVVGDESYFDARRSVPGWKPTYLLRESPSLGALVVDRGLYGGRPTLEPARIAALLFRDALRREGVAVPGGVRVEESSAPDFPLAFVQSPPLAELVRHMGVSSDNFTAELLLKQLGAEELGLGTSAGGAAVVVTALRLLGVPTSGVRVVDGSGLSLHNRLTAISLVSVLRTGSSHPELGPVFVRTLAVAGVSGTLRKRLVALRGSVQAKTGTTSAASALAGYVRGRYAFAILHNGRPVPAAAARRAQDRFVRVLAAS
jgi:serine-type D-Ala-D-Ala carboxypeptidase/endopeptidase (penicillin-binding protein 4)